MKMSYIILKKFVLTYEGNKAPYRFTGRANYW